MLVNCRRETHGKKRDETGAILNLFDYGDKITFDFRTAKRLLPSMWEMFDLTINIIIVRLIKMNRQISFEVDELDIIFS